MNEQNVCLYEWNRFKLLDPIKEREEEEEEGSSDLKEKPKSTKDTKSFEESFNFIQASVIKS